MKKFGSFQDRCINEKFWNELALSSSKPDFNEVRAKNLIEIACKNSKAVFYKIFDPFNERQPSFDAFIKLKKELALLPPSERDAQCPSSKNALTQNQWTEIAQYGYSNNSMN
jgi:hypothetical protein